MGNSIIPLENPNKNITTKLSSEPIDKQYIQISQKKQNIIGTPKIVKSNISNLQLEEYIVNNNDTTIQYNIHLYKLRSSSYSKSIVVVYHHKLIDQSLKIFLVRTQKMKGRLNQIQGLTLMEGLVLLEAAFGGFSELVSHAKSPFPITDKMISINSSNMVRVWLNENYAINKILHPGKVQNENQMIHQAFTIVQDRVHPQQRHAFSEIRCRIGQCPRIADAKHIIGNILLNSNRKFILQELVEKQIRKANISFSNKKVPMNNFHEIHQTHNLNTLSPFNHHQITSPEVQKIRISPQEYIKDDQGSDRIRLVRQEMKSPSGHIFIGSPLHQNATLVNNRRQIFSEPKNNDQRDQRPHSSMMISPNSKDIYLKEQEKNTRKSNVFIQKTNPSQNNPNLRMPSNEKQTTHIERSPRLRTIFGSQAAIAQDKVKSPRGVSPIKNVSPLKLKQDQNSSAYNLTNKIALSQNKLSQMQKKINKLKQQFNKNKKQKQKQRNIQFNQISQKNEEHVLTNSPLNHTNNQNAQALPINKNNTQYSLNKLHGGRPKWENKKSDFYDKSSSTRPNNTQGQSTQAINQRKSQIFNAGKNNQILTKSALSQNPAHLRQYKVASNPNFQFRSQNNFPSDINLNPNTQPPTFSRIDQNQISKTSISNFDNDTKSSIQRYNLGQQQSQFRLISSPFTLNMNNGYRIVTENKSSIIGTRNHF